MEYCKLCGHRKFLDNLRQTDQAVAELIRTAFNQTSFSNYNKVCMFCIKNKLQVLADNSGKALRIEREYVFFDDRTISNIRGAIRPSSTQSSVNSIELVLYLQYIKQNKMPSREIRGQFSPSTTIENVIMYLNKALNLSISIYNVISTSIESDDKKVRQIKALVSSQTLSDLEIENYAHLRFEYFDNSTVTTSDSSFYVKVKYSANGHVEEYRFNDNDTIDAFLSFIVTKFQLTDIEKSSLRLSSNHDMLDTTNVDKTLVSLKIGTKYSVLDLDVTSRKKSQPDTNEMKNQSKHVIVTCYYQPQKVTVDLSRMRTIADAKQKIIDELKLQNNYSLTIDNVHLTLNDSPVEETDDECLLRIFDTESKSKLKAELNICPNVNCTSLRMTNEASIGKNGSPSAKEKSELSSPILSIVPKRADPVGLCNLNNTCFMNSALQCLSHAIPLTSFFLSTIVKEQANNNDDKYLNPFESYGEVTSAYAKFIWHMWKGTRSTFSPNELREVIGKVAPRFTTYEQQDAQEFMTFLLNSMHNEMKEKKKDIIKKLFYGTINSITTCLQCKKPKITSNVISFLPVPLVQYKRSFTVHYIPFNNSKEEDVVIEVVATGRVEHLIHAFAKQKGLYHQRLHVLSCDNGNYQFPKEKKLSEILELTVTICDEGYDREIFYRPPPPFEDGLRLIDCIHEFLTLESTENTWFCKEYCNAPTHTLKQMQLCSLPPVLIIQLKRFTNENGRRRKLDMMVKCPLDGLDLNDLLPEEYNCAKNAIYDLVAVSNHSGSIHGGHYTAYARQEKDGTWYSFNDECVHRIDNNDEIVSRNAYLLVYLQRQKE